MHCCISRCVRVIVYNDDVNAYTVVCACVYVVNVVVVFTFVVLAGNVVGVVGRVYVVSNVAAVSYIIDVVLGFAIAI